jgi:universal stress protein E
MFKNVLVLADGADPNQPALRRAMTCVDDSGQVAILDVVYEPMLEAYLGNREIYEPLRRRVVGERRERAAALARAVESWGVRGTANAVWNQHVHAAVVNEVIAKDIDLVVTAPVAGSGLSHNDWQLVANCPAPFLVVKSDGQVKYRSVVAAVDPFHAHAKPADLDAAIVRNAKALQALTGATLAVLHCYLPLHYFGADLGQPVSQDPNFVDGRQVALARLCRDAGLPAESARIVAGAPQGVLRAMHERGEADLVVMGALARGRLKELLIGNTAERVLHRGGADVLLIKPPDVGGAAHS